MMRNSRKAMLDNAHKEMMERCSKVGRCSSCKFWGNPTYNNKEEEIGRCSKLSGIHRKDVNSEDVYPDIKNTGIESVPICWHDGSGFDYETKSWFGCVHYNAR